MSVESPELDEQNNALSCRACLSCENTNIMYSLMDPEIRAIFTSCTSIEVHPDEELPLKICSLCFERCESWNSFISQCWESDDKLRKQKGETVKTIEDEEDNESVFESTDDDTFSDIIEETDADEYDEFLENDEDSVKDPLPAPTQSQLTSAKDSRKQFDCDICGRSYTSASARKRHRLTHGEAKFCCEICGAKFHNQQAIRCHLITHSRDKPYECEECGTKFKHKHTLVQHGRRHLEKNYSCQECGKQFFTGSELRVHIRRVHTRERPFQCSICDKTFMQKSHLKDHTARHLATRCFKCECGAGFTTRQGLSHHSKVHKDEQPGQYRALRTTEATAFFCEVCGAQFGHRRSLEIHMISHSDEQPYECDECGKKFKYKHGLAQHRRRHKGEKNHTCPEPDCGKQFFTGSELTVHKKKVHSTDRPYKCTMCDRSFIQPSHLKRHQAQHTGERSFTCKECGNGFTTKLALNNHMKIHTGEKSHQCNVCKRFFRLKDTLRIHMRTHAAIE